MCKDHVMILTSLDLFSELLIIFFSNQTVKTRANEFSPGCKKNQGRV